jgi:uncharacterized protein
MKQSPFNILVPSGHEDTEILVNSFSRTIAEIPRREADALRGEGSVSAEVLEVFRRMGAVTDDPSGQRHLVHGAFLEEQSNTRQLVLVLPLTTRCNLKCTYCYQIVHGDFQGDTAPSLPEWDEHSVTAVEQFVARQLAVEPYGGVQIRWYGGEPLLRLQLIEEMGARLQAVTSAAGRDFSGMVVTNGTLLSDKAMLVLERVGVNRLEISLDGPAPDHDALRRSRDGRPTYERVLQSIVDAGERFQTVVFRVNVHALNADHIESWISDVAPRLTGPNIYLKFKLVEGDHSNTLTYEDFTRFTLSYARAARAAGLKLLQGRLTTETCPAIRKNYYIVQQDLRVYKCPQNLGSGDHVGEIAGDGSFVPTDRLAAWINYDVANNADCTSCAHAPHCNGGCPYNEIMATIRPRTLQLYRRKERCCSEKLVPELLVSRLL